MKIHNLLTQDMILSDLKAREADDVIKEMVDFLRKKNLISKEKDLCEKLTQREKLGSTAIGDGVAIPHCKMKSVNKPIVMLALSQKGVNFHSLDGKPSRIFFLVVSSPDNPSLNLQILAAIAHLVRKADSLPKKLLEARHIGEVWEVIRREEEKLDD